MFSQSTGYRTCYVKAVISVLFTVIMGILVLLTGLNCIISVLHHHHHHHSYNQDKKILPFKYNGCIKYNLNSTFQKIFHKLEVTELSNKTAMCYFVN